MGRWSPGARGRLQEAAYALFMEHGYERTTVADIASRAKLTERTFFRHFADKREVLFAGSEVLLSELERIVAAMPPHVAPIDAVRAAIEGISQPMRGRHDQSRARERLIAAHPDLRERSLIKRATLTSTLAAALVARGVDAARAALAADVGIGIFYVAFERWIAGAGDRELTDFVREGFEQLAMLTAGR